MKALIECKDKNKKCIMACVAGKRVGIENKIILMVFPVLSNNQ